MSNKFTYFIAALMLGFMLCIAFFSLLGDSAIMDEVAHLPAGYSYVTHADMRLNPEHPPLVKDIAGLSILVASKIFDKTVNFPENIAPWQNDVNGQWNFGFNFMYQAGNDADWLLFFGRLPMLLILLLLGIFVFKWTRELFGKGAALLALFLFAFSPTFIAHGRFVTTDVAAAAGIFISCYYFWRWLKNPSAKTLIIAGLVFGLAQLTKFSAFLLAPLFCFAALVWIYLKMVEEKKDGQEFWPSFRKNFRRFFGGLILIFVIGFGLIVWPVYLFHVFNYPMQKQQEDIKFILSSFGFRPLADFIYWLAGIPVWRALAQYGFGLAMVAQRASGGNTTYFLGQISAAGSSLYFPFVYLVKETLTLHILTLIALILWLKNLMAQKIWRLENLNKILKNNFPQFLMLSFIALYWYSSIDSSLNIGVRHILPTFCLIFVLAAGQISSWLKFGKPEEESGILKALGRAAKEIKWLALKYLLIIVLIVWQIASVVSIYPSFLAYFNELIGPANAYKYVADSNLDWGQDLKRLTQFVKENNIQKIYVDYFGGAIPFYYLNGKSQFWQSSYSPKNLKNGAWLAVSATFLDGGQGAPAPGFKDQTGQYNWLKNFTPRAVIGHSIFVFFIPPGFSFADQ